MNRWFAAWSLLVVVFGLPATTVAQTRTVTLEWDPSTDLVAGYIVYVGTHPQIYGESYDVGTRTSFVYSKGILGERYYFAVASYETTPAIAGAPSLPISTVVPGAPTTIVLQPPSVQDATVRLDWSNSGPPIAEYLLEVGRASGEVDLFAGSAGQNTSITAPVGPGIYYVRLRGRTLAETFVLSNEVIASVGPCQAPPQTPTGLTGGVSGGVATLSWNPAAGAVSYLIQVGTAPGLGDLFQGPVGAATSVSAPVASGFSAFARVAAVNACGVSGPSAEIVVQ